MPIYEYECKACGTLSEVIQKVGEDPPTCTCNTVMVKRVSTTSFILKGGGWATDGYGR